MKLRIIAVGTRMPEWVQIACEDYTRRLPAEWGLELRALKPEPRTSGKTPTQMMAAEAQRIIAALPPASLRIALDERGTELTTVAFAHTLQQWRTLGQDIAFIVGGPDGLDVSLKATCSQKIRLSAMTLPHAFVRILLVEQLYRAWTLLTHHPYHRT